MDSSDEKTLLESLDPVIVELLKENVRLKHNVPDPYVYICLYYHDHPGAKLSISPHPSKKFADFLPKVMAFREKSVTLQRVLRTKCAEN